MMKTIISTILCVLLVVSCATQSTKANKATEKVAAPAFPITGTVAVTAMPSATAEETLQQENPQYTISVTLGGEKMGDIVIELFPQIAPKHVRNFDSLVSVSFYDGTLFHRLVPGFVIQGGDPTTKTQPREKWGRGDPAQTKVPAEFNDYKHIRGTISAARASDPNSATSQFFICVDDTPNLDGSYTAYGKVLSGMEVVDKIVELPRDEKDRPIERVEMRVRRNNKK